MRIKKIIGLIKIMEVNFSETFDEELKPSCPICETNDVNEGFCNKCEYHFEHLFSCPLIDYKIKNESNKKICNIDQSECNYKGTMYETCDKYHEHNT